LAAYRDLGDKLFCFRLGFGWVFPIGEGTRSFNVGLKLYLSLPHEKPALIRYMTR
jgi:flavin-dependent dehydrogenase